MKAYLCGPINGCTNDECKNWREAAKLILGEDNIIDPMRRDYRGRENDCVTEIVENDKSDIMLSSVLLVNYDKPSVGTSMEILFAWERNKPIVVVAKKGTVLSPWLRYHSTHIVESFEKAFDILKLEYYN